MRTLLRGKAKLLVLAFAVVLAVPAIALADTLNADADGDALATPNGNGTTANQAPGTTEPYPFSAYIKETGNALDDVFPGTVNVSITRGGEWLATDTTGAGSPSSFSFTSYGAAQNGTVRITVPSGTPVCTTKQVTVKLTADRSTNGESLNSTNDTITLHYNITANGNPATDCSASTPPANVAPTADAGGPYEFGEGSATNQLNGSGNDTDGTIASYAWDLDYDGTNFTVDSTSEDPNFDATYIDGPDQRTVALRVTDNGGAQSPIDTEGVTIVNVAPTASTPTFNLNPVLGTATAGFAFSDASTLDTHGPNLSYFTWSGLGDTGNRMATVAETNGSGTASDSRTLATGCYPNLGVTGTAVDDDGGASAPPPLSIYSASSTTPASVYSKAFRPPIQDNERNIAKFGNVVPVKVQLTNPCTGTTVTNQSLYITVAKGLNGEFIEDTNTVADSVSSADTGQQMRIADGGYIYNLSTKNLSANTDWAVRVRLGAADGPIILQAVLYPKK